jgi:hypothetical protein
MHAVFISAQEVFRSISPIWLFLASASNWNWLQTGALFFDHFTVSPLGKIDWLLEINNFNMNMHKF